MIPSHKVLRTFDVSQPRHIETTAIATIWKVARSDGSSAALKIYNSEDMRNEAVGFDYLASLNGRGAAFIYQVADGAALLEWLDGPSLGDMARSGEDMKAASLVAKTAKTLHFPTPATAKTLPTMASIFAALLEVEIPRHWPRDIKDALKRTQSLARYLLATSPPPEPLHGDLHHDNIRLGTRGYCAFDAKGIMGEPSYELANAVQNPLGMGAEIRDPSRMDAVCALYATALNVPINRFLQMTAVKCGLSICWRLDNKKADPDPEVDLLEMLLEKSGA